jgi:hypothetical protein
MSRQELESKIFNQLDVLNDANQLNIGGMVMALTMSVDPEYKKLNWVDMNTYVKAWIKKNYMSNGTGEESEKESSGEQSEGS